jgi:thiol-disulfide isomerase/thioredoxin
MRRRIATLAAAAAVLLTAGGCSSLHGLQGTGNNQYVTGATQVRQIPVSQRGDAVTFSGRDLDGTPMSLTALRGRPTVINVWWAGCPPCRQEAPLLVGAARQLGSQAHFVGIDVRDAGTAGPKAFQSQFHIPWPSFYSPGGQGMLAFPGTLTPDTIPATVVLDAQGRVAASIVGSVPSQLTLVEVVRSVARHG